MTEVTSAASEMRSTALTCRSSGSGSRAPSARLAACRYHAAAAPAATSGAVRPMRWRPATAVEDTASRAERKAASEGPQAGGPSRCVPLSAQPQDGQEEAPLLP